jgi:hypothetical protein
MHDWVLYLQSACIGVEGIDLTGLYDRILFEIKHTIRTQQNLHLP